MYSYVLYYNIEKSGFNVVSASLVLYGIRKGFIFNLEFKKTFEGILQFEMSEW